MTSTLVEAARILLHAMDGQLSIAGAVRTLREALEAHDERDGFAETCWSAEDVRCLRPDWSEQRAREFLQRRSGLIQDAMVTAAWEAIEVLLVLDEREEEQQRG